VYSDLFEKFIEIKYFALSNFVEARNLPQSFDFLSLLEALNHTRYDWALSEAVGHRWAELGKFTTPSNHLRKKKSKIFLLQKLSKKSNWVSWMKFLQFKDNLWRKFNIRRPCWLKTWHKLFYEHFLWRLENSKIMKNMSEIAKKTLIFGKFLIRALD